MGSVYHLAGEEAASQCRPNSGPDGIFLVNRCVLLFWTLTVKHAGYQSEFRTLCIFANLLVLTLLSNRGDQVKLFSDIWVDLSKRVHLSDGGSAR